MQKKKMFLISLSMLLVACDRPGNDTQQQAHPIKEVGIATLHSQSITLRSDLSGRVNATMTSDVRPQGRQPLWTSQ